MDRIRHTIKDLLSLGATCIKKIKGRKRDRETERQRDRETEAERDR